MKKLIILTAVIVFAISYQSCQSGDNGAQAAKDWATIDSLANAKGTAFSDSLINACMMAATEKGMYMADSMMNAAKKGGKSGTKKTNTTTTPAPEPKKEGGKLGDKLGTQDGKLKDKVNSDPSKNSSGGKLKDKLPK